MGITDHLTFMLRILYAGQEATVKTGHETSVQFSRSVMSSSLRPQGLKHARPPCPSPTPGVCSNSCPLSRWCHPTISSSVVRFSSLLQSCPASGSFKMSQLFISGGQSIAVSASTSVLPEHQTGSKLGKEYIKAVYCHPAYLNYMQSTSWEMLDWKKHKLE